MREHALWILMAMVTAYGLFIAWVLFKDDWAKLRRKRLTDNTEVKPETPKRGTFYVIAGGDWRGKQKYETREDASDLARRLATRGHDCLVVQLLEMHEATYSVKTEKFD